MKAKAEQAAKAKAEKDAKAKKAKEEREDAPKRSRASSQHESPSLAGSDDEGGAKRAKTANTQRRQQGGDKTPTTPSPNAHAALEQKRAQRAAMKQKQDLQQEVKRLNRAKKLPSVPEDASVTDAASDLEPAKARWDPALLEAARKSPSFRPILCAAHPHACTHAQTPCQTMCAPSERLRQSSGACPRA